MKIQANYYSILIIFSFIGVAFGFVRQLKPSTGQLNTPLTNNLTWLSYEIKSDKMVEFLVIATLEQCVGPDASKYTLIAQYSTDPSCSASSIQFNSETLTSESIKDEKTVNHLHALGRGLYAQGTNVDDEGLFFVQSGPGSLEGKYVYIRGSWLKEEYLKKCSSLLGYSYVSSKKIALLIADKLDLNVFLSSSGAFEVFKKSAQTVCTGHGYIF